MFDCHSERSEESLINSGPIAGDESEMLESPASGFRISLRRFVQFATGRIRRGGHANAVKR